jgi:hypothetical protein
VKTRLNGAFLGDKSPSDFSGNVFLVNVSEACRAGNTSLAK